MAVVGVKRRCSFGGLGLVAIYWTNDCSECEGLLLSSGGRSKDCISKENTLLWWISYSGGRCCCWFAPVAYIGRSSIPQLGSGLPRSSIDLLCCACLFFPIMRAIRCDAPWQCGLKLVLWILN